MNLQSLMNIRNYLDVNNNNNRNNQPAANRNAENENQEAGINLMGAPVGNGGGDIFGRAVYWIFKVIQIAILYQLG